MSCSHVNLVNSENQFVIADDILGPQIATECVMAGQTLWIQIAELMDIISKENLDPGVFPSSSPIKFCVVFV